MRRWRRLAVPLAASLVLFVRPAAAHQFTTRFDAPLPTAFVVAGVAGVLGGALLAHAGPPRWALPWWSLPVSRHLARPLRLVASLGFLALVGGAVYASRTDVLTAAVWTLWLRGVALLAVLVGTPWRTLAPWDRLGRLLDRVAPWSYPSALGAWPAVAGYVVLVGVVENFTVVPVRPEATAVVVAGYAAVVAVGLLAFGREWAVNADPFDALYRVLGRTAPLAVERRDDGGWALSFGVPWRACTALPTTSLAALAVAVGYTVLVDGVVESALYWRVLPAARVVYGPGVAVVGYLAGLGVALATVAALARRARGRGWHEGFRILGGALLPATAAALVARDVVYVLTVAGRVLGVDVLSGVPLPTVFAGQVGLVVLGGVVAARAAREGGVRGGRALVVGYALCTLWTLSLSVA